MKIAEVDLVYKTHVKEKDRPRITSSKDAYLIFRQQWNEDRIELVEEFKLLLLNRANRVLGIYELSKGGISGTVVDARLVFVVALITAASGIVLCHNHPSQHLIPSLQDEQLTNQLKEAGKLLNIKVMDHLIICREGYYSFTDEGLL